MTITSVSHRTHGRLQLDEDAVTTLSACERARLFLEFAGETSRIDVPDPYYGNTSDFELVLDLLEVASRRLLHRFTETM